MTLSIAILAGGRSTRMAADKALLPVGGIPMLQRIARTALQVSPTLLIVGREKLSAWPADLPATFLPDDPSLETASAAGESRSRGPLSGLITALQHTQGPMLLLPCDAPLLGASLLQKLIAARRPDALATLATTPDGPEPLLAIYTPALLPTLRSMLADNRRALHPLASLAGVRHFPVPLEHRHELLNLNTPADLERAESLLNSANLSG